MTSIFKFFKGYSMVILKYAWVLFRVSSSASTTGEARNPVVYYQSRLGKHLLSYYQSKLSKYIDSDITDQGSVKIPPSLIKWWRSLVGWQLIKASQLVKFSSIVLKQLDQSNSCAVFFFWYSSKIIELVLQ